MKLCVCVFFSLLLQSTFALSSFLRLFRYSLTYVFFFLMLIINALLFCAVHMFLDTLNELDRLTKQTTFMFFLLDYDDQTR